MDFIIQNIVTLNIPSQALVVAGLILLATFYIKRYIQRRTMVALINKIPGAPGHFIFGHAIEIIKLQSKDRFQHRVETLCEYGKTISKFWNFNRPTILVHKADSAQVLLRDLKNIEKGNFYNFLQNWLREGLLTSTGLKWHSRRKLLTPAFHFKILQDFIEMFNDKGQKLVSKLEKWENKSEFNIFPYITKCTLDIILESAMGVSFSVQEENDSDYVKAVYTITQLLGGRPTIPWKRSNFLYRIFGYKRVEDDALKILHTFSTKIIKERRETFRRKQTSPIEENDLGIKKHQAFLDLLIEKAVEDNSLTDEDIREEVDTFVFEGHDTTASAITFAIFLLGCHPHIQARVQEELDSIFLGSDRPATMDDLRQMKYLECCIKEALRLYPPVPIIARTITEPIELDGYRIPAGINANVLIYTINRDPKHFPDPKKYFPERFFPENSEKRHPYAYVPFSAGPRNCIGQKFALLEEKVVLSSIFRHLNVKSIDTMDTLQVLGQLILRPENGVVVKIASRTSNK